MSNGDPINAGEKSYETQTTALFPQEGWSPGGPLCYIGVSIDEGLVSADAAPGLIARGNSGGDGVIGWGGVNQGSGVVGFGGVSFTKSGKDWTPTLSGGDGVAGVGGDGRAGYTADFSTSAPVESGMGVIGIGGDGDATLPTNAHASQPVAGNVGVWGQGGQPGGSEPQGSGVVGIASSTALALSPNLMLQGNGVAGAGPTGVYGFSDQGAGVFGEVAVSGTPVDNRKMGVRGSVTGGPSKQLGPYAGWFDGPVHITDSLVVAQDFTVMGNKHVAAPFPDGSLRKLYCVESPECWFEDFGEAKLVKGKAQVMLPRDFAAVIKTDSYHVFLAPYGRSNGLYVSKRNRQGFAVEEQGNGKSNLKFSFRIVGKRKGVKAERFAKVTVPKPVKPPMLPLDRKQKEQPPRKPTIRPFSSGVLSAVPSR
jgi:hypothetical protein